MIKRSAAILGLSILLAGSCNALAQKEMQGAGRFPIMNWDGLRAGSELSADPHTGIPSLKECNYNTISFIRPEQIKTCEKLGLTAFLRPAGHPIKWREM